MKYVILAPVYLIIWGAILFPVVSSIYGLIKWRAGWRTASAIPLLVMAVTIACLLSDTHGWGALLFIPLTMMLSAYSGVVVLLHRKRTATNDPSGS